MEKEKLLSIVVPTKNRYKYLKYLIQLVEGFQSNLIELVVHDNSDDNSEIIPFINNINFNCLKYYYSKEKLSVKDNCDQAILHSTGEYVCMLGDDDGLLPSVISVVQYMKENSIDYLLSLPSYYNWPDFYDPSIFNLTSAISYTKGSGKYIRLYPIKELKKAMNNGFDGLYRMPKVYQAVVSRRFLNMVYEKCSTFSPGPSPDMANAVALSLLNGKLYQYDAPLFISGQCRSFGGGERLIGAYNLKKITEVPFLPQNIEEMWSKRIPTYWCADTIWPQSGIEAVKTMGGNLDCLSYEQILAKFVFNHPLYYKECKSLIESKYAFCKSYLSYAFNKAKAFFTHRITYFISGKTKINEYRIARKIDTIIEAVDYLENVN